MVLSVKKHNVEEEEEEEKMIEGYKNCDKQRFVYLFLVQEKLSTGRERDDP